MSGGGRVNCVFADFMISFFFFFFFFSFFPSRLWRRHSCSQST